MFPGNAALQAPRALLAPFQGAIRVSWALSGGCTTGSFLACLRHGRFGGCAVIAHLKPSRMASTHLSLHDHLVFGTKNREPWLSPTHRQRVHSSIGGIMRNMDGVAHAVGGTGDHLHIAADLRATLCLADVMRKVKSESSRWIHEELRLAGFAWQEGYGAFTFAAPDLETVRAYVLNQEEHHRVKTFQEEYVAMLKRGMVAYEERFLW